jgi:sugar phosphate isomerase/epimerase
MGQPELSFEGICALKERFELEFVELRSLGGTIDLPGYFERWEGTFPKGSVRLVASSLNLIPANENDIADFFRFAAVAQKVNAPYVRVFGGGPWGEPLADAALHAAADMVGQLRLGLAERGFNCEMLLETHSAFSSSKACARLNARLEQPLHILWDSHHTWRLTEETVNESWCQLRPWIRHIHYKDSVADSSDKEGYRYVLPGAGEYPSAELFQCLRQAHYSGGVSLEWEKLWHADLPPLDIALAAFNQATKNSNEK